MRVEIEGKICEMGDDRHGKPMIAVETAGQSIVRIPMSREQVLQFRYAEYVNIILETKDQKITVTKEEN